VSRFDSVPLGHDLNNRIPTSIRPCAGRGKDGRFARAAQVVHVAAARADPGETSRRACDSPDHRIPEKYFGQKSAGVLNSGRPDLPCLPMPSGWS